MTLLLVYVFVALGFSFLCSIAEAVLLSVSKPYVVILEQEGKPSGRVLRGLKEDINQPLAAILTLNTVAHTVGAAGAGAQAAAVFGSAYVGVISAVLTLLILVFSEIIPKTLGAVFWRKLAPSTAFMLRGLIWVLYPFVWMAQKLTQGLPGEPTLNGFSRREFAAMADLGAAEGQLEKRESRIIKNLFLLHATTVKDVMTPRPVVFALPDDLTVAEFFAAHPGKRFSRIPIYHESLDNVTGFVLRDDLLLAQARGNSQSPLTTYRRDLPALPETTSLSEALETCLDKRAHIVLVVDDFGGMQGILTQEDVLETLLGLEIMDEGDRVPDMQEYARRLWRKRAREMGLEITD